LAQSRQSVPLRCFSWDLAHEIIDCGSRIFDREELETVFACIQCGTCSGGCPAGRYTNMRTRKVIRSIQLGLRDGLLSSDDLWACATCYTCQERCPRNVKITDIIRIARNIAFESGYARKAHLYITRNFLKIGHSIRHTEDGKKLRSSLGLDETPPTTLIYPEAMQEVSKLTELTGFKRKILGGENR